MKRWLQHDLVPATLTIALIAAAYAWFSRGGMPRASSLVGMSLGIAGFALMLWAEVGYTLRKRLRRFQRGSMQFWLRVHIFAGLVGAALALLHAGGRFHGLAAIVAGCTLLIVVSGIVGRFLYTSIPRTLEGGELTLPALLMECENAGRRLMALGLRADDPILQERMPHFAWPLILGRSWFRWRRSSQIRRLIRQLPAEHQPQAQEIRELLEARFAWLLEVRTLAATRRLLSLWHAFHVPLGIVLFTLAGMHIAAALYYFTPPR